MRFKNGELIRNYREMVNISGLRGRSDFFPAALVKRPGIAAMPLPLQPRRRGGQSSRSDPGWARRRGTQAGETRTVGTGVGGIKISRIGQLE
jgi:hypothetical protein